MRSLLLSFVLTAALAGCGGADPAPPEGDVAGRSASAPVDSSPTAGRTGEATTAASDSELARLADGGRISPSSGRPNGRERHGVGAGAACTDVDLIPTAETVAVVEQAVLCLLNGERVDRGMVALTENPQLAQAALGHARDMVAQRYFAHDGKDGSTMTDRIAATGYIPKDASWIIGENLAWGTGSLSTARSIMDAWMNSQGHRENILNERFREIGLGTALGNPSTGDSGATYAHEFGARGDAPQPVAPAATHGEQARPSRAFPSRRALARQRRACRRLDGRRARRCRARVARRARAARVARRARAAAQR